MSEEIQYTDHFLYPSTLHVSKSPCLINTVLGSCISVCLWDPIQKIGGMNHYMMPFWNGSGLASPKFGNIAIPKLIENILAYGCNKNSLIVKVFGGGEVLQTTSSQFMIGDRNITIAMETLKEQNLQIKSQSVGGKSGRKIVFNTYTGEVLHRFIEKSV